MSKLQKCDICGKLAYEGETVTLTIAEFETLSKLAATAQYRTAISAYRAASRSAIARKPELATFILDCAVTMTVGEITSAVAQKFGASAPSRSSIFRFIEAVKRKR